MPIESVRHLSQEELRDWRRNFPRGWQRASYTIQRSPDKSGEQVEMVDGAAQVPSVAPKPSTPTESYEMAKAHYTKHMKRSRHDYQVMVRALRTTDPGLIDHLTDAQAAAQLESAWDRKIRASIERVYHRLGRERELQIKTGGF